MAQKVEGLNVQTMNSPDRTFEPCSAKATHIFSAKNIRILYIESAKTVNEMTLTSSLS